MLLKERAPFSECHFVPCIASGRTPLGATRTDTPRRTSLSLADTPRRMSLVDSPRRLSLALQQLGVSGVERLGRGEVYVRPVSNCSVCVAGAGPHAVIGLGESAQQLPSGLHHRPDGLDEQTSLLSAGMRDGHHFWRLSISLYTIRKNVCDLNI